MTDEDMSTLIYNGAIALSATYPEQNIDYWFKKAIELADMTFDTPHVAVTAMDMARDQGRETSVFAETLLEKRAERSRTEKVTTAARAS